MIINNDIVLCTIHHAENTDEPHRLLDIVMALNDIAKNKQAILPLHPRSKKFQAGEYDASNLTIIDLVGNLDMV